MSSPERDAGTTAATSSSPAPAQFSSWQAGADFLQELWGKPDTSSELGAVAETIIAAEPTPAGRIARALAFVRREIRGLEGPLRLDHAPLPPREVLRMTAGGAADRAALLWHLLRRIGMPARPVFVGTAASAGDSPPSLGAFDRVLVEVAGRCHSVDAPDAERDRALANTPLGLTLAPGIVDLEPIAPWQPAPAEMVQEAAPKPPPMALRPAAAAPKPVQVEFVMDFASMVTARAAEVEAALFASTPPPPAPRKPEPAREPSTEASSARQILVPRAATTTPEPEPVKPAGTSDEAVVISPESAAESVPPVPPPAPPLPAFSEEASMKASPAPETLVTHVPTSAPEPEPAAPVGAPEAPAPAAPEPVPEMAAPAPPASPEPAPVEPIAEAVVPVPPAAEDITLPPSPTPALENPAAALPASAMEKPTREPIHRRSLREELEQRAKSHRQSVRDPRPNPPARPSMREQPAAEHAAPEHAAPERTVPELPAPKRTSRPPVRASDDSERWEYNFDPTHRARRTGMGGQFKLALMVIGFLAVIALWIFVFMAKRGPQ